MGSGRRIRTCPLSLLLRIPTIRNRIWGSSFLPPVYQGTKVNVEGSPIFDVARPRDVTEQQQETFLQLVTDLDRVQKKQ
jgi:hypothetical protein